MFRSLKHSYSTSMPYIVSAKRTPVGKFLGSLSHIHPTDLGALAIMGALFSTGLDPKVIDEVILGCSLASSLGQNPCRQASIFAGIPTYVPCTTISNSNTSGLDSVILSSRSLEMGQNNVVVAGGFEGMSYVPFHILNHRQGDKYGDQKLRDSIVDDGLLNSITKSTVGSCAEQIADKFGVSREVQDAYSVVMYERAINASKKEGFAEEMLYLSEERSQHLHDDQGLNGFKKDVFKGLQPIYTSGGSITVGNSAAIADGASAAILASKQAIKKHRLPPLARIVAYGRTAVEAESFCLAIPEVCKKVLNIANLKPEDVDLYQIGELFSVSTIVAMKVLGIPIDKVNVHGGCVSLGDPIGMTGVRLLTSLVNVLALRKRRYGIAAIANGMGEGSAILIQNLRL